MKIKAADRVIYDHNPLVQVLCQVRFDRILTLVSEIPAEFQKRLAPLFPKYDVEQLASLQWSFSSAGAKTPPQQADVPSIHHFSSEDGQKKVSISADFFAYSCAKYEKWEVFHREFEELFRNFENLYPPTALQRIGLRYRDLIEREAIGLEGVPWRELVSPVVAGVFASQDFFEHELDESDYSDIEQSGQVQMSLKECDVLLQTTLLRSTSQRPTRAFLIDSDFFHDAQTRKLSRDRMAECLKTLHDNADAVFRACIRKPLHDALGPNRF